MSAFTQWTGITPVGPDTADYRATDPTHWEISFIGSGAFVSIRTGDVAQVSVPYLRVWVWIEQRLPPRWRERWGRICLYRHPDMIRMAFIHDQALELGHDWIAAAGMSRRTLRALGWGRSTSLTICLLILLKGGVKSIMPHIEVPS